MRSTIPLMLLLLASCASDKSSRTDDGYAPVTHEPYGSEMRDFQTHSPDAVAWKPGPPSLPPGVQIAVLEGDPKERGPFVFRLKAPEGYIIPPHMHPRAERVTILQGTFHIAEGSSIAETRDAGKGRTMPAGSFGYWPARMPHVAWVSGGRGGGETIIQLHGFGPWSIEYLNPQDDPRSAKTK